MSVEYKRVLDNLEEFKRRYDRYAGQLIRFKKQAPIFHDCSNILQNAVCNCMNLENMEVSAFPRVTATFGSLILVRCKTCGYAYVPEVDFDLDKYYSSDYQIEVQPFRLGNEKFFIESNEFLTTETYKRFLNRAKLMLSLVRDNKDRSILDFGCGVGILLRESLAKQKFAVEKDPFSVRILKGEIGAKVIDLDKFRGKVDSIILSHVIEHIAPADLISVMSQIKTKLSRDGIIAIAVPDGADQIRRLRQGNRDGILFEPHLSHFSLISLLNLCKNLQLQVSHVSTPTSVTADSELYSASFLSNYQLIDSKDLMVVCHR